jgi:hypothetical protein
MGPEYTNFNSVDLIAKILEADPNDPILIF